VGVEDVALTRKSPPRKWRNCDSLDSWGNKTSGSTIASTKVWFVIKLPLLGMKKNVGSVAVFIY
jgi:hypothetical protein